MTRRILLAALLLLLITPLFLIPVKALAQTNFPKRSAVVLEKGETVNTNYFAAGELVNLEGTVNGDAYLAAGKISIEGTVNGDVLAAGGSVSIRGVVTGNVRVAGGQISISGVVGRNITAAGGEITVLKDANVTGSLTAAGGNIEVNAPLGRGLEAGAGTLTVANYVAGDLTFAGERLYLAPSANIGGDVVYFSDKEAQVSDGALISGKVVRNSPLVRMKEPQKITKGAVAGIVTFWAIYSFISALILGAILVKIAPNFLLRVSSQMQTRFWRSLGIGFLSAIVVPIVFIVILVTVFAIPLGFILLFLYGLAFYVAKVFASLFIGQLFVNRFLSKQKLFVVFLMGLVIYSILGIIPFAGGFVQLILVLAGVGALLAEKKKLFATLSQKKLL